MTDDTSIPRRVRVRGEERIYRSALQDLHQQAMETYRAPAAALDFGRYDSRRYDFRESHRLYELRLQLTETYGYCIPTEAALEIIAALGPLVSIGAGLGYWEHILGQLRVDCLAYDREIDSARLWFPVRRGGPQQAALYADRALLLIWPPYDLPMALECLQTHHDAGGRAVAYVGEVWGCTGSDEFHQFLETHYQVQSETELPMYGEFIHVQCGTYLRLEEDSS
ncbi:MAG: hypothetical protein Q7T33_03570 [Dehalococcoidia bacterium]|nr:hypothetical protein [Dehalococcoidia bacterium]